MLSTFLTNAPLEASLRATVEADCPDLGSRLAALVDRAVQAWPTVKCDRLEFVGHLAKRLPTLASAADLVEALDGVHAEDLLLAFACAQGDTAAHSVFDKTVLGTLAALPARLSPSELDEVRQLVRERLLLPDGERPPRIDTYLGLGPLKGWVRVAAVRVALNHLAKRKGDPLQQGELVAEGEQRADLIGAHYDVELQHMAERYREVFKTAFSSALGALSPRDRTLLRLHFVDGLNIERIGKMYSVHRATVARWIAGLRQTLFAGTRQELMSRLEITSTEVDSILRLVNDNLEISLLRHLE